MQPHVELCIKVGVDTCQGQFVRMIELCDRTLYYRSVTSKYKLHSGNEMLPSNE